MKVHTAFFIALLLAALSFFQGARAGSSSLTATCQNIGLISGCSGCELGSKGLCSWISERVQPRLLRFSCVPSLNVPALIKNSNRRIAAAGSMCRATNVGTERSVKTAVTTAPAGSSKRELLQESVPAKSAGTTFSKTVQSDKINFGATTSTTTRRVDRTAGYERLGQLRNFRRTTTKRQATLTNAFTDDLSCENINSMELVTELDSFDGCFVGTTGSGAAYGPIQRECKGLVTAAWAAMLCVPYGQAVTGFCNSLTKKVEEICSKAGCVPTFPWDSFDLPMRRSNTDKFCYRNLTALKMSIAYQDTEGFFRALKTAEKPGMLGTFVRTSEPGVLTVLRYAGDGGPPIMTPNFTFIDIVLNDQRFQRSSISRLIQKICFGPSQKGFVTDCYNTWPGLDQFETGDAMIGQFTGLVYIPADGPYDVDFYSQGPRSNYYRLRFSAFQFTSDGDRGGANSFSGLELRKGWIPFELTSVCVTEQCPRFGYRGFFSVRPTGAPYPEYPDFILPGDPAVFGAYPAGMRSKVMSDAEVFALASNLYVEP